MCLLDSIIKEEFKPVNTKELEGKEKDLLLHIINSDNLLTFNNLIEYIGKKEKTRKLIINLRQKGFIRWIMLDIEEPKYIVNPYIVWE